MLKHIAVKNLKKAMKNKSTTQKNSAKIVNDFLEKYAGHIGYSVRPTEKTQGICKRNAQNGTSVLPRDRDRKGTDYLR